MARSTLSRDVGSRHDFERGGLLRPDFWIQGSSRQMSHGR